MTFETKDGTITEDEKNLTVIREAVTKTQEGFDGLKGQVDKFEKELKKFGSADILTKEVLEKQTEGLQKSIDDLDASLKAERKEREGLESRMNKSGTSDEAAAIEKKLITMNMTYAAHRKDSAVMSAEDYPHYKSAMNKYLRQGNDALTPEEQKAIRVGSDPSGGYFVMPDETGEVVAFVHESSAMRQMANIKTIGTDRVTGKYKLGQAGSSWTGETATRAETGTADYGKWEIPAHELYAWPEISLQAMEDMSINPQAELAADVAEEFSRTEETAFFIGTGVGQPRGFLTYTAGTPASTSVGAFEVIRQTDTGVNGNFAANPDGGDIFYDLIGQTKAPYLQGAEWMMNRLVLSLTRKLRDGDDNYLWERSFQKGQPFQILEFPVRSAEDMPAAATGSLSVAFGNFKRGYTIVDRLGLTTLIDPYTSTTGFVKFKTRKRVGGAVTNFEAIQLMNFQA